MRRARAGCVLLVIVGTLVAACGGNGSGLDENGRPIDEGGNGPPPPPAGQPFAPTIEAIQDNVFSPICARCHAGALAPQGLRLSDAQTSYNNLVNQPSSEQPSILRVKPGDADNSYVIHKLEGTQASGNRMPNGCPQRQPCLEQGTIDVIREWIATGAAPPGSSTNFLMQAEPGAAP